MEILESGGRCGSKGCIGMEGEEHDEVSTTGTFPIFYLLIQSKRVATEQFWKY